MGKLRKTRSIALIVLALLFAIKGFLIDTGGKSVYREWFLIASTAALILVLVYCAMSIWREKQRSQDD